VEVVREFSDPLDLTNEIQNIAANGQTSLFTALLTAFKIAVKYSMPAYILLLTDGNPTDVTDTRTYEKMSIPQGVQIISFGIGDDYNEELLKILSDRTGSTFYHIQEASEIPEKLPRAAKTKIAGKNVTVDIISESPVKLLNYPQLPVKINAVEGVIKILGETVIPPKYNGNLRSIMKILLKMLRMR
jgi:Ca-activated chloride channel family protein